MKLGSKAALTAVLCVGLAAGPALASTKPTKATLAAETPVVKWTGANDTSNPVECFGPLACDHFALTVKPVEGKNVKVFVDVPDTFDYDLYVYNGDGELVASGPGGFYGEDETAIIKAPKADTYDVVIQPWFVAPGTTYKASASFVTPKP
jgi:hypothetical protein